MWGGGIALSLAGLRRGYGLGEEYVRGVAGWGVREARRREAVDDGEVTDGCIADTKIPHWHKSLACATTVASNSSPHRGIATD